MVEGFCLKIGDEISTKNGIKATVIDLYRKKDDKYNKRVKLLFEWGEEKEVGYYALLKKGLYEPTVSQSHSPIFTIYKRYDGIKQRCSNPKSKSYKNYGARGITCSFDTFWDFYNHVKTLDNFGDVLKNPNSYEIDRIDNNKSYVVGNLRWATLSENQRNKNNNFLYDIVDMFSGKILFTGIKTDCESFIKKTTGCKTSIHMELGLLKYNIGALKGFRLRAEPNDIKEKELYMKKLRKHLDELIKLHCYNLYDIDGNICCFGTARTIKEYLKTQYGMKPKINHSNYKNYDFLIKRGLRMEYVGDFCKYDIESIAYDLK